MGPQKVDYHIAVLDKGKNEANIESPKGFGKRHIQALILFLSLTIAISLRAQLSVSIVAMTTPKEPILGCGCLQNTENVSTINDTWTDLNESTSLPDDNKCICVDNEQSIPNSWSVFRTYNWKKETQEMIVTSFFVGYTTMMIPMGLVAQKFGGKLPIMVAMGVNGVMSIITPWLALFCGWIGVCFCRLLQGMTQAAMFSSIHTILGKWAPVSERGRLSTRVYTGNQLGVMLAFQISGLLGGSPSFGWPFNFWVFGFASLICFGLVKWFISSTPHEHPNITYEELSYILGNGDVKKPKERKTPWKYILTSMPVWGLVATQIGSTMGYMLLLTQTPTYMSNVLGVNIKNNGLLSSLPYIAMYTMSLLFGLMSDFLANKKILSITNIRRVFNTIGMMVAGFFMIAFAYVDSVLVAITLLILCLGLHSGIAVGYHINHIDLAPNFAGPLMAVGNMMGQLSSLLVPVIVVNIVRDDLKNQYLWRMVFIIIACIKIVTNAIYVVFVKGTVQEWNFYGADDDDTTEMVEKKAGLDEPKENEMKQ